MQTRADRQAGAEPARYISPCEYGSSPIANAWVLPGLSAAYGSGPEPAGPAPSPKYSGSP